MYKMVVMVWVVVSVLCVNTALAWKVRPIPLRSSSFSKNTYLKSVAPLYGIAAAAGGGIYEYKGQTKNGQPPPELAEFLGFGSKKITAGKRKSDHRKKRTGPTDKQARIARREALQAKKTPDSFEELERRVFGKYGQSTALKRLESGHQHDNIRQESAVEEYEAEDEEQEEDEEERHQKKTPSSRFLRKRDPKFDPFLAAVEDPDRKKKVTCTNTKLPSKEDPSKPEPVVKEATPEPAKGKKYKNWDIDFDEERVISPQEKEEPAAPVEVRSGPMNALSGFRLRPPPPPDPAKVAREVAKEKALQEKEQRLAEKLAELKRQHKKSFRAFDFTDKDASYDGSEVEISDLFTSGTFEDLGVTHPQVLENLRNMQVDAPTQIQAAAIPALHEGRNVVLQAQTGSGKTLAFLLPLLKVVDPNKKQVQAIILAPSRELVQQIGHVATSLFQGTDFRVQTIIGGANVHHQTHHLRDDRPHILVATPGRLAEIVFKLEKLRLGGVRVVIVDEVDSMMTESYVGEVETILQASPLYSPTTARRLELQHSTGADPTASALHTAQDEATEREFAMMKEDPMQRLLWLASATSQDPAVAAFADRYTARSGKGWSEISVTDGSALPDTITHGLISIGRDRAPEYLKRVLLAKPAVQSALIFVNDPYKVEVVVRDLARYGLIAAPLHGDTNKDDRKEIVARIKDGRLKYVVATELAARGIDIPDLSHVINFELPTDAPHYVHRTGRCGRAGRKGLVINFANPETKFVIRRFGKKLGVNIQDCEIRDGRVYLKQDE